jgi:hypothetical protein
LWRENSVVECGDWEKRLLWELKTARRGCCGNLRQQEEVAVGTEDSKKRLLWELKTARRGCCGN